MGDRLYAIPWSALTLDTNEECFRLDVTPDRIKNAPGFFKDRWPSMADPQCGTTVHEYYMRTLTGLTRALPVHPRRDEIVQE